MQQKMLLANINFQNINKPYRISPHEVLDCIFQSQLYHLKKEEKGGLKDKGGGGVITFFPSKGRLIREVRNLTP